MADGNKSEVARILCNIGLEYEAARNGLQGLAQGTLRHSFITTRMENMTRLQQELEKIVGTGAAVLVANYMDTIPEQSQKMQATE